MRPNVSSLKLKWHVFPFQLFISSRLWVGTVSWTNISNNVTILNEILSYKSAVLSLLRQKPILIKATVRLVKFIKKYCAWVLHSSAGMSSPKDDSGETSAETDPGKSTTSALAAGGVTPVLVDARVLTRILNQTKVSILTRIRQLLPKFTGDGSTEVTVWLAKLERLCELEQIAPIEILMYMLGDNAA